MEGKNPFLPQKKLARSPDKETPGTSQQSQLAEASKITQSMEVIESVESKDIGRKRKKIASAESSPEKISRSKLSKDYKEIIAGIRRAQNLAMVKYPTTQNGIKLELEALRAKIDDFREEWEDSDADAEASQKLIEDLREESRVKSEEIAKLEETLEFLEGVEIARLKQKIAKLEDEKHGLQPAELDKKIGEIRSEKDVAKLIARNWDRSCLRKAKTSTRSIQALAPTRVIVANMENSKDAEVIKRLGSQYPILITKMPEQVPNKPILIRMQEQLVDEEVQMMSGQRTLIVVKTKSSSVEDIARALKVAGTKLNETEKEKITLHITHDVDVTTALKLAECCLDEGTSGAELCAKGRKLKSRPETETSTLIVRNEEGKSYAEVVRAMKTSIDPEKQQVKIQKLSKTRDGHIAVRIKEGDENARRKLREEINQATGSVVEVLRGARTQIVIHDLEETTTAAEIEEKIREETEETGEITVKEPRESKTGAWTSTVTLPKKSGERLVKHRRIRIGWNSCRVTHKIYVPFCSNCATAGHTSHQCKENRTEQKRCFRCTDIGHEAANCDKEPRCNTCKVEGHQAISMECPKYNKFMTDKINGDRKRTEKNKTEQKNDQDTPDQPQ